MATCKAEDYLATTGFKTEDLSCCTKGMDVKRCRWDIMGFVHYKYRRTDNKNWFAQKVRHLNCLNCIGEMLVLAGNWQK